MHSGKYKVSYRIIIGCFIFALVIIHNRSMSQEQLGMRLENFAGTAGLSLNPSTFLTGDLGWDFQLGGAGAFMANNYAYIENTGLFRFIKQRDQMEWALAFSPNPPGGENVFLVHFYDGSSKKYFHVNTFISGPSLVTKLGDHKSIGFFTNLRMAGNSFNIPGVLSYFAYNNRPFQQPFSVHPWDASVMSWMELGIHYSWKIKGFESPVFAGINLKYIQGDVSMYISNNTAYTHTKLPENSISLENPDFRFGFTGIPESLPFFQRNGSGMGVDLGVSKILSKDGNGYILKAGISLMDLGFIRFNNNSEDHRLSIDSTIFMRWEDYENIRFPFELEEAVQIINSRSLEGNQNTLISDQYRLMLPTALIFQLDYRMSGNIYFNGILIQNLSLAGRGPIRANLLAFTPRWENRFFSVSATISVFQWNQLHFGLATRIGGLTIGSDHIHGLFNGGNFSGMDLYISLRLQSWMFGGKKNGLFGKRSTGVDCFEF